jgi:hypothetical protein
MTRDAAMKNTDTTKITHSFLILLASSERGVPPLPPTWGALKGTGASYFRSRVVASIFLIDVSKASLNQEKTGGSCSVSDAWAWDRAFIKRADLLWYATTISFVTLRSGALRELRAKAVFGFLHNS